MKSKIVAIGEVLWDLLPTGPQLGGAPANFACHARALGADARLVTRVGRDPLGGRVLDRFGQLGLPVDAVQVDPELPTGTVEVSLDAHGHARYAIRAGAAWDAIEADAPALALARQADAVCFGSLAQRSAASRRAIRALVAASKPGAFRVFDVNLRAPFVDRDVVAESLGLANVLKLNDDELPELARMFGLSPEPAEARATMQGLARCFGLSLIALTRGAAGSLLMADGVWSDHPGGADVAVVDTIGAGDSFTAALVVGLLMGRPLEEVNRHANDVAAFVCSQPGATPPLPEPLRAPTPASNPGRPGAPASAPACCLPLEVRS